MCPLHARLSDTERRHQLPVYSVVIPELAWSECRGDVTLPPVPCFRDVPIVHPFDEEPDARLVERLQHDKTGDTRPFDILLKRHQHFVVGNCRFLTRSSGEAEDLAQEVFVKAYFAIRRFEGRAQFRSWIQRIKVNHCLNFLRKNRGVSMVDVDDPALADDPRLEQPAVASTKLEQAEQRQQIARALDSMSDTLRVPLRLRDADGMSYEEIAERLGIRLPAVKMRIKRGREEFRRLLDTGSEGTVGSDRSANLTRPPANRGAVNG